VGQDSPPRPAPAGTSPSGLPSHCASPAPVQQTPGDSPRLLLRASPARRRWPNPGTPARTRPPQVISRHAGVSQPPAAAAHVAAGWPLGPLGLAGVGDPVRGVGQPARAPAAAAVGAQAGPVPLMGGQVALTVKATGQANAHRHAAPVAQSSWPPAHP